MRRSTQSMNSLSTKRWSANWAEGRVLFAERQSLWNEKQDDCRSFSDDRAVTCRVRPAIFWGNLGRSYKKRNSIIHSGETAQEADAELALSVARKVVEIMASLKPKNPKPKK